MLVKFSGYDPPIYEPRQLSSNEKKAWTGLKPWSDLCDARAVLYQ